MIDLDPRPLNNIISLISRHYYAREGYLIIPSAYTTVTQYQQLVISDFFTINLNSIITMICLKLEVYCSNGNRPFCWNCKLRFIEKQIKQSNITWEIEILTVGWWFFRVHFIIHPQSFLAWKQLTFIYLIPLPWRLMDF